MNTISFTPRDINVLVADIMDILLSGDQLETIQIIRDDDTELEKAIKCTCALSAAFALDWSESGSNDLCAMMSEASKAGRIFHPYVRYLCRTIMQRITADIPHDVRVEIRALLLALDRRQHKVPFLCEQFIIMIWIAWTSARMFSVADIPIAIRITARGTVSLVIKNGMNTTRIQVWKLSHDSSWFQKFQLVNATMTTNRLDPRCIK